MQLTANLLTISAIASLLVSGATAATLGKRDLVASFVMSGEDGCSDHPFTFDIPVGQACGVCTNVPSAPGNSSKSPSLQSIVVNTLDPRCRVTVYNQADCSDPGIVSGTGPCWSPPGRIHAYKVDCPWYPEGANPPACSSEPTG